MTTPIVYKGSEYAVFISQRLLYNIMESQDIIYCFPAVSESGLLATQFVIVFQIPF